MTLIPLSYSLQPRKSGEQLGSPIHFIGVLFVGLFLTGSKINKTTGHPNQGLLLHNIIHAIISCSQIKPSGHLSSYNCEPEKLSVFAQNSQVHNLLDKDAFSFSFASVNHHS